MATFKVTETSLNSHARRTDVSFEFVASVAPMHWNGLVE
jgi:hypothetical protein